MTLTVPLRRARSANPRQRRELASAISMVRSSVDYTRRRDGEWPTVPVLAVELEDNWGWRKAAVRLHRWLTNGTLPGSKLRVRTDGAGVVRIEISE